MQVLSYKNNKLFIENVDIHELSSKFGTPLYCYSYNKILHQFNSLKELFKSKSSIIAFAVKANSNLSILKLLAENGSGFDTVSEGEIRRVIKAGGDPKKIIFSGVGKTIEEFTYALTVGIKQFNIESLAELELLDKVAGEIGVKASVSLRMNPNVDSKSNAKISTGKKGDKFGIDKEYINSYVENIKKLHNIDLIGLSTHIGSQITEINPFNDSFKIFVEKAKELINLGYNIKTLDFGGGIGVNYNNNSVINLVEYRDIIFDLTKDLDIEIVIEPGRFITCNAGILISKVIYNKRIDNAHNIIIVDAGMNDLMRPSMYNAYHEIKPAKISDNDEVEEQDIVGPVCESSDYFAKLRKIKKLSHNDIIVIEDSGAYGFTMANNYNSRLMPAEILVKDTEYKVIRNRDKFEDLLARDIIVDF